MILRPPVWVTELAARFWAESGPAPPFPRDLRDSINFNDNLRCLEVPNLTLSLATARFRALGVPVGNVGVDRPLAGCFAGHCSTAVICFDSTLDAAELRFTLAHEVAHYLRDFREPRRKLASRLGAKSLEVLDGLRAPTFAERFAGVFRHVAVVAHTHFLARDERGFTVTEDAAEAEEAADRLAFELLAPWAELSNRNLHQSIRPRDLYAELLVCEFGFSAKQAQKYSKILTF